MLTRDDDDLAARLAELATEYGVPGASIAVTDGDAVVTAACGVLNQDTGVEATTDSIWQIGSITKVWTATLIMQLVDEGQVDLDAPVRKYLPDLELSDPEATEAVTVRHLLTHTSGIDGDAFDEFGRGDECVERYVHNVRNLAQLGAPGRIFSYCNAGFVILGRLIEVLRGQSWDAVLREYLIGPLGLTSMATLPEEAILRRAAVGHIPVEEGSDELRVAPIWQMTRAMGPAGAALSATPAELISFARMHMGGGVAADGTRVLSAASVNLMQQRQVEIPDLLGSRGCGISWLLTGGEGPRVIGHDGGTIGQSAFLRLVPEADFAVSLLTNGGRAILVFLALVRELLEEATGAKLPSFPVPPRPEIAYDPARFAGVYERAGMRYDLAPGADGRLWSTATPAAGPPPGSAEATRVRGRMKRLERRPR
jgi:CubicO group peptidase (beta-lactamase class C family)